jgi:hypothetical protein
LTPILLAKGILSRIIMGIGTIVVIKSANELTIPHPSVTFPSSKHFAPTIGGNVQNARTGLAVVSQEAVIEGYQQKSIPALPDSRNNERESHRCLEGHDDMDHNLELEKSTVFYQPIIEK